MSPNDSYQDKEDILSKTSIKEYIDKIGQSAKNLVADTKSYAPFMMINPHQCI